MQFIVIKYLVTAGLVVLISETAKHFDRLGALIAALPTVTLLTLMWLHFEGQPADKISNHAWFTFWYVLPTLPMFALFPTVYSRLGFWPTLGVSVLVTMFCFVVTVFLARAIDIELL